MSLALQSASKTILIVDDTPANLRLLGSLLSTQGYITRLAPSGSLALMAVQQQLPDLILLDIRMPKMNGYEVCQRLKLAPQTREIPVIFLSALQEGGDKARAFEVGGADYITKPFQAEEVIARVRHQLQLLELQHQLRQQQQALLEQNEQLQQEICDRQATEAHLNRMTSRLAALIHNLQAGILVENEYRKVVFTNQEFCNLFGLAQTPADLFETDCAQLMGQIVQQGVPIRQTRRQLDTGVGDQPWVMAEEIRLANGTILERDCVPINTDHRFQGYLWQYRDITARKANEQALLKTSQALAAFSNSLKQLHRLSLKYFETFHQLAEDYLNTGCQILNFSAGVIGFLDGDHYVIAAIQAELTDLYVGFRCQVKHTFCSRAIEEKKTITYAHIGILPEMQAHPLYQAFKLESCITTPIFVDGEVYGSLSFFSKTPRTQGFIHHEAEIIELMAQSVGKFLSSHRIEQQRQRAEAALRDSEARFRQLAERIEHVFWIWESAQQKFTYVSPAYEAIWGRPSQNLLDNPQLWSAALHTEGDDRLPPLPSAGMAYDEEYQIVRPDGTIRWIRDRAFPIRDRPDQADRLIGIAEDITEIKQQEQALRKIFEGTAATTGSKFFRSLACYLVEVLQVSHVLITQQLNTHWVKALAFWQDDAFLDSCEYSVAGAPCERVLQGQTIFYPDNLRERYPQHPAFQLWDVDSYLGIPLTDSNQTIIGHLAILNRQPMVPSKFRELVLKIFAARAGAELERQTFEEEIQRARELADRANRAKSEFLANVSHELRTPLNAILGFTQLVLNEAQVEDRIREYLEIVNRSGTHLLTLINDVLEMSKIESGKTALHPNTVDLHDLLYSLEDMFSLRAQAKDVQLQLDCVTNLPQLILADGSKLRQVLINLLGNAVKFTQQGQITLRITVIPPVATTAPADDTPLGTAIDGPDSSPVRLVFAVADTGPGMTPEEVDTLFEPFIQTHAGHLSQEGTGLGLPISQRFVRLMGGDLQVETELGKGSTFSFEIQVPWVHGSEGETPLPPVNIGALSPVRSRYRLLVVEDQPANRLLLLRVLETAGFTVRSAENGFDALEQAKAWKPHLIWMDIRMPLMDGYEATRKIKAVGLTPAPVIIALTASAFEEERTRVMAAGCDDFVRKPFQIDQILQKISQHLPEQYIQRNCLDISTSADVPLPRHGLKMRQPTPEQQAAILRELPEEWVEAMRQAAMKGSDDRILQLIEANLPAQSPLSLTLTGWAKDFKFDTILQWLPNDTDDSSLPQLNEVQ